MIIYKITNKINGKLYIGQTIKSMNNRIQGHYKNYKKNVHTKLYDAMRKYGWENFEFSPICTCSNIQTLNELEKYFIEYYGTINDGYNTLPGGISNPMHNEDVKNKHLKRMQSIETRQKISKAMKRLRAEKGFSEETRRRISESLKKLPPRKKGFKMPKEAVEKITRAHFKSVYCIDKFGQKVAEFNNLLEADFWWYNQGYHVKNYRNLSNMIKASAVHDRYIRGLKWFYK